MNKIAQHKISSYFVLSSLILTLSLTFQNPTIKAPFHQVSISEIRPKNETNFSYVFSHQSCTQKKNELKTFANNWKKTHRNDSFQFTVIDPSTSCMMNFESRSTTTYPMASTVKFDIAVRILQLVELKKFKFSQVKTDLSKMMRHSDNQSAQYLWEIMGGRRSFDLFAQSNGLKRTHHGSTWGSALTSSADQGILLTKVFAKSGGLLNPTHQTYLRWLMTDVNEDQTWGAGKMFAHPHWIVGVKNGWYFTNAGDFGIANRWRINTLGVIWDSNHNQRFIFSGFSNAWKTDKDGKSAWTELAKKSAEIFLEVDMQVT